jgi:hypothetical protein
VDPNVKRFLQQIRRRISKPHVEQPHLSQPDAAAASQQISRDTLVLVAALVFLALAILLAVLFPGGRQQPGLSTEPTVAATSPALAQHPTAIVVPRATSTSAAGATAAVPPAEAYPAPGQPAGMAPTALPTQEPLRPTAAPGTEGTPVGDLAAQPTAYPGPATGGTVTGPTAQPIQTPAQAVPTAAVATPDAAQPTAPAPQPTAEPTTLPQPTAAQQPPPTAPIQAASSDPPPTRPPTRPTAPPVDAIRGTTYWTADRSPIALGRDVQVMPGAALIVEPGTEVRLGPGVSLYVDGQLLALGQPDRPVRFVSADRPRWEGIFGRAGSNIVLEHAELSGAGAGGTAIAVENGTLALRGARVRDSGGHVRVTGGAVELRDSEIAGNDMPYGAALDITFTSGGSVTLLGNRIGGNRMAAGAPPVQINSQSPFDTINLDIQRNLLVGQDGPNLTLVTNGQLQGPIVCNALVGGANGLSIRGTLPQVPGLPLLRVRENAIEKHTPPILPVYLEFGIGRGATSEVGLDMRENWWESDLGPYEPDRHADGRGDAVGENITFDPWLTARPACAPVQ